MERNLQFTEYNAWFQPKSNLTPTPLKITGNASDFVKQECQLGLNRIWGELSESDNFNLELVIDKSLAEEDYLLKKNKSGFTVSGGSDAGSLYGIYRLINLLAIGNTFDEINESSSPKAKYRVINHWDNMDGSIERGYSGKSIFFKDNQFDYSEKRIKDYARMLASIGINGIAINNVNVTKVSVGLIVEPLLNDMARLADIFRPFGIKLCCSVNFDSPVTLGGLSTPDPFDDKVQEWWRETAKGIYKAIPDFMGFVVKADSEFRDGPAAIGRTQADGANTMARALKPFGGVIFWRCFIYNCKQDWRDTVTDRPKAAYDTFMPLDGCFDDNVILQIKFGPVDFQTREPISPLFYGLNKTTQAIEYQITQEYTGHQIDLYALAVQWEEINQTTAKNGRTIAEMFGREINTACAVPNIGDDDNWTGHFLAQCNMYAFGRIAWNPALTADEIIEEWVKLTFDTDPYALNVISNMLKKSRGIYEGYTAPYGLGFMVAPHLHYGPDMEGYEFAKWGTYHRANHEAVGVDRTVKGTGYTVQYPENIQKMYENPETCPEELLLFFHRIRYDYVMKNGKTLIQNIYDTHFKAYEAAKGLLNDWINIEKMLPKGVFNSVKSRLLKQEENAKEWCDRINTYFYRFTGIKDEKGRKIYE